MEPDPFQPRPSPANLSILDTADKQVEALEALRAYVDCTYAKCEASLARKYPDGWGGPAALETEPGSMFMLIGMAQAYGAVKRMLDENVTEWPRTMPG